MGQNFVIDMFTLILSLKSSQPQQWPQPGFQATEVAQLSDWEIIDTGKIFIKIHSFVHLGF